MYKISVQFKQKNKWRGTSLKFCTLWYVVADYDCCVTLEWILSAKKLDSRSQTTIVPCYHNPYLWQSHEIWVFFTFSVDLTYCAAPSILPKSGWAIPHSAHLPLTPLPNVRSKRNLLKRNIFSKEISPRRKSLPKRNLFSKETSSQKKSLLKRNLFPKEVFSWDISSSWKKYVYSKEISAWKKYLLERNISSRKKCLCSYMKSSRKIFIFWINSTWFLFVAIVPDFLNDLYRGSGVNVILSPEWIVSCAWNEFLQQANKMSRVSWSFVVLQHKLHMVEGVQ